MKICQQAANVKIGEQPSPSVTSVASRRFQGTCYRRALPNYPFVCGYSPRIRTLFRSTRTDGNSTPWEWTISMSVYNGVYRGKCFVFVFLSGSVAYPHGHWYRGGGAHLSIPRDDHPGLRPLDFTMFSNLVALHSGMDELRRASTFCLDSLTNTCLRPSSHAQDPRNYDEGLACVHDRSTGIQSWRSVSPLRLRPRSQRFAYPHTPPLNIPSVLLSCHFFDFPEEDE